MVTEVLSLDTVKLNSQLDYELDLKREPSLESISSYTLTTPESEQNSTHQQSIIIPFSSSTSYDYILTASHHFITILFDHTLNQNTLLEKNVFDQPIQHQVITKSTLSHDHLSPFSPNQSIAITGDSDDYFNYLPQFNKLNKLLFLLDLKSSKKALFQNVRLIDKLIFSSNQQEDYDLAVLNAIWYEREREVNKNELRHHIFLFNLFSQSEYTVSDIDKLNNEQVKYLYNQSKDKQLNSFNQLTDIYFQLTNRKYQALEYIKYNENSNNLIIGFNLPPIDQLKLILNDKKTNSDLLNIVAFEDEVVKEKIIELLQKNQYKKIIIIEYTDEENNNNNNNNNNKLYYYLLSLVYKFNTKIKVLNFNIDLSKEAVDFVEMKQKIYELNKTNYVKEVNYNNELAIKFQLIQETQLNNEFNYNNSTFNKLKKEYKLLTRTTKESVNNVHFESHQVIINYQYNKHTITSNPNELLYLNFNQFYKLPLYLKLNPHVKVVILLGDQNLHYNKLFERLKIDNNQIQYYHLRINNNQQDFRILLSLLWYFKDIKLQSWIQKEYNISNEQIELYKKGIEQQLLPINIQSEVINVDEKIQLNFYTSKEISILNKKNQLLNYNLQLKWNLAFKEIYEPEQILRPDIENPMILKLSHRQRLTPLDYDRNVFHLEFDSLPNQQLKYEIGDALAVYPKNPANLVELLLLRFPNIDKDRIVKLLNEEDSTISYYRTGWQVLTQHLDLFGKPNKLFYKNVANYAIDNNEKQHLLKLSEKEGEEEYKFNLANSVSYFDIFNQYKSIQLDVSDLIQLIPTIEPRHYSISSSNKVHPNQVHLLVVTVHWDTPYGLRNGLATHYLDQLQINEELTVAIKPSVMKLPPNDDQPIIMAGLGTGMAPFRAFIEERYHLQKLGHNVGPMALYFGSRYRQQEYLYGDELDDYHQQELLKYLRLAFSRDQKEKVYIQNLMQQDKQYLNEWIMEKKAHFYLCGPTWPELDVRNAVKEAICLTKGYDSKKALELIEELKEEERYVLELY